MARTMGRLKAAWVERIKVRLEAGKSQEPKDIDMHCDGHGLYLQVSERGASWIFRYTRNGRKPEMGLGSLSLFGIEEARAMALDARKLLHAGIDPLEHRNAVTMACVSLPARTRSIWDGTPPQSQLRLRRGAKL